MNYISENYENIIRFSKIQVLLIVQIAIFGITFFAYKKNQMSTDRESGSLVLHCIATFHFFQDNIPVH